jgi:hypothetical protein
MRSPLPALALASLATLSLSAAAFNATGVEQGLFSGLERYLSQSRFPLRTLHPKAEIAYAQVTDSRGPAYADSKTWSGRVCDTSDNGRFGFFLEASYSGSRADLRTCNAPVSSSPLDVTGMGGGVFTELPILAKLGVYAEYGYFYNKLDFVAPAGLSLLPAKDNYTQGRYGLRLFLTDTDALSYGQISGQGVYLPAFDREASWRHALGAQSSFNLRYKTGPGVKSWEAAFGLGF